MNLANFGYLICIFIPIFGYEILIKHISCNIECGNGKHVYGKLKKNVVKNFQYFLKPLVKMLQNLIKLTFICKVNRIIMDCFGDILI